VVSELALLPSDRTLRRWDLAAAELKRLGLRPPAGWAGIGAGSEPNRG
jgi:hypothetical protein